MLEDVLVRALAGMLGVCNLSELLHDQGLHQHFVSPAFKEMFYVGRQLIPRHANDHTVVSHGSKSFGGRGSIHVRHHEIHQDSIVKS